MDLLDLEMGLPDEEILLTEQDLFFFIDDEDGEATDLDSE